MKLRIEACREVTKRFLLSAGFHELNAATRGIYAIIGLEMISTETNRPARSCTPFLRWAGSKRRLLPVLKEYWKSEHKRYLEPFAGSACLFFALNPPKAILGDLNPDLIKMYLEVKYRLEGVLRELQLLTPADTNEYARVRRLDVKSLSPEAAAARFIYLNRFCFNGLYRTNKRGEFNVPYGGARSGALPHPDLYRLCSLRMRTARFIRGDFERVLRFARQGDLVYMDPPFAVRGRRVFREYDAATFGHSDIQRLRNWMEKLSKARIHFVVSYAESDEADLLRKGFTCEVVPVRRHISGFASSRVITNEVIISNM